MKSNLFRQSVTINTTVPESFQLSALKATLYFAVVDEISDKFYFYLFISSYKMG